MSIVPTSSAMVGILAMPSDTLGLFLSKMESGEREAYRAAFMMYMDTAMDFADRFNEVRKPLCFLVSPTNYDQSAVSLYIGTENDGNIRLECATGNNMRALLDAKLLVLGVSGQNGNLIPVDSVKERKEDVGIFFNVNAENAADIHFQPQTLVFASQNQYEIWAGYSIDFCRNLRRVERLQVNVK